MDKKSQPLITAVAFVLTLVVGGWYISASPYGYTESAILFLAGIVGAGLLLAGLLPARRTQKW